MVPGEILIEFSYMEVSQNIDFTVEMQRFTARSAKYWLNLVDQSQSTLAHTDQAIAHVATKLKKWINPNLIVDVDPVLPVLRLKVKG